jgi:hypothetical protein
MMAHTESIDLVSEFDVLLCHCVAVCVRCNWLRIRRRAGSSGGYIPLQPCHSEVQRANIAQCLVEAGFAFQPFCLVVSEVTSQPAHTLAEYAAAEALQEGKEPVDA